MSTSGYAHEAKLDKLIEKARKRLVKVGCTDPPKLYLFATCG